LIQDIRATSLDIVLVMVSPALSLCEGGLAWSQ